MGEYDSDVVIVGGGVGGSSLATTLARAGMAVEVLEKERQFVDRVRGEWMAPWGVAETQRLGVYDVLMAAGGHHLTRAVNYDELLAPEEAEAAALAVDEMLPDVPGALCMEHVAMQNALLDAAREAGVTVRRGVSNVSVETGARPSVGFSHEGDERRLTCRLVVGADGRTSSVRRQIGRRLNEEPVDHLISGLLVDGAHEWPGDVQSVGKAGDVMYLVFPQGNGKIRLYVDYGMNQRGRYAGRAGAGNLLQAFAADALRGGQSIPDARPIGPCKAFPSQNSSLDQPYADGVVLIGDAAGYTDPIWGQGLSVTFRDARVVRDLLLDNASWRAAMFEPYAEERRERSRRIACETRFATSLFARFDDDAIAARTRAMGRMAADPELGGLLAAAFVGPDALPSEVFTGAYYDAIFAP